MKNYIGLLFIFIVGCNSPISVVTDPFNQQSTYISTIDADNSSNFTIVMGDLKIKALILKAEKKDDIIITNKMIWRFTSNNNFQIQDDQIELSVSGKIYRLKMSMIDTAVDSTSHTEGYAVGSVFTNKTLGGLNSSSTGVVESTSKTTNVHNHIFELNLSNDLFEDLATIDIHKPFYIKVTAKTQNGITACVWGSVLDPNDPSRYTVNSDILDYYTKLKNVSTSKAIDPQS